MIVLQHHLGVEAPEGGKEGGAIGEAELELHLETTLKMCAHGNVLDDKTANE
ncbi:hypothetical protein D3C85_1897410 [compost metagenome]